MAPTPFIESPLANDDMIVEAWSTELWSVLAHELLVFPLGSWSR